MTSVNYRNGQVFFDALVCKNDIPLVWDWFGFILPMERDNDRSGRIRRRKYARKDVWIGPFGLDELGTVTESDKQLLVYTKTMPHEEDLLTAGNRTMIWADLLKAKRRRDFSGRFRGLGRQRAIDICSIWRF